MEEGRQGFEKRMTAERETDTAVEERIATVAMTDNVFGFTRRARSSQRKKSQGNESWFWLGLSWETPTPGWKYESSLLRNVTLLLRIRSYFVYLLPSYKQVHILLNICVSVFFFGTAARGALQVPNNVDCSVQLKTYHRSLALFTSH